MKYLFLITVSLFLGAASQADSQFDVKITSMSNVPGNGAIEACGTATSKTGIKPVLVILQHVDSVYTTIAAPNDQWCILFKRSNMSGDVTVTASSLDQKEIGTPQHF